MLTVVVFILLKEVVTLELFIKDAVVVIVVVVAVALNVVIEALELVLKVLPDDVVIAVPDVDVVIDVVIVVNVSVVSVGGDEVDFLVVVNADDSFKFYESFFYKLINN